jgi:hypothetical protein
MKAIVEGLEEMAFARQGLGKQVLAASDTLRPHRRYHIQ